MNGRDDGTRDMVRLLVGLLLGGGIVGGVTKMLERPDAVLPGIAILVFCVTVAVGLFVYGEWLVDRRRQRSLKKLGAAYVQLLNSTGQRLVDRLETVAVENRLRPSEMRVYVLTTLADFLAQARPPTREPEEWEEVFLEATGTTVNDWRGLAAVEEKEGFFPSGAEPMPLDR